MKKLLMIGLFTLTLIVPEAIQADSLPEALVKAAKGDTKPLKQIANRHVQALKRGIEKLGLTKKSSSDPKKNNNNLLPIDPPIPK